MEVLRENPNKRIIAQFPWIGKIYTLTRIARADAAQKVQLIRQSFPPALHPERMILFPEAKFAMKELEQKAQQFEASSLPKTLPTDLTGDFAMAWWPHLAGQLSFLINDLAEKKTLPRVLQIACNFGPLLSFISNETGAEVHGIDMNKAAVDFAVSSGNYFVRHGLAQNMPFENSSFDFIISRHFLCSNYPRAYFPWASENELDIIRKEALEWSIFIPHALKVLSEMNRALKPGGYLISAQDESLITPETAGMFFRRFIEVEGHGIRLLQK